MADELHLNTDETVVDRIGKVGYGGFLSFNNDLVLTNQNVILVKKGLFGDVQDVVKFPLSSLRVVSRRCNSAQCAAACGRECGF